MSDAFDAVARLLRSSSDHDSLAEPLLSALPVSGASISTLGKLLGTETVSASDDLIARVDEVQFDLGEGPCWDALATRAPVLEPDLHGDRPARWPAFSSALAEEDVASIFAFPMLVGPLKIGAVDLYSRRREHLNDEQTEGTQRLAALLGRLVLRKALADSGVDIADDGNRFSRRIIHQATGFIIAQVGLSADDAHLLLQGQAFAEGRTMQEVARDVVERRLSFSADRNTIEDNK